MKVDGRHFRSIWLEPDGFTVGAIDQRRLPHEFIVARLTSVADAARQMGFVNACAGKSVEDLPREMPLFIARAGQDQMPGLNDALDRFMIKALTCNLPVTFVNHPRGPHAFDLLDDSEGSREIIKRILAFLRFHLLA